MLKIAYAHDGTSIYDTLFLEELIKKHRVYLLTFNHRTVSVPKQVLTLQIHEPLDTLTRSIDLFEGLRMYLSFLLRAVLFKLALLRVKPQLVIGCLTMKYGFYSTLARFRPTILIVWGSDVLIGPKRSIFFRFLAKYSLSKADAVIVDSEVQKHAALQLGCSPEKIFKFPWFDLTKVRVNTGRNQIRRRLGWQDNTVIISARNHEPIYGVEHLLEAIPYIVKEAPKTRFLIVGKGSLTEKLKQRVDELKIKNYVEFTGSIQHQNLLDYVNAADINVSTSFSDGTSASLLEAMTLQIPSVVTDIPGNREWVIDNWSGLFVPVAKPVDLAEKIISLVKDKEKRQRFGENARKTVEKRVDWSKTSQVINELIQKLSQREGK